MQPDQTPEISDVQESVNQTEVVTEIYNEEEEEDGVYDLIIGAHLDTRTETIPHWSLLLSQ